ncbi:MAG: hypothetical protein GEV07_17360 [Streptosporangiales bacterium]|nr:hypothetical protein [Streptosporangiales bacterium]
MATSKLLEPKKTLGAVTAVAAAFTGIFLYGQDNSQLGMILVFMLPVAALGMLARARGGFRGWLYLAVAWTLGVLGLGVLLGVN